MRLLAVVLVVAAGCGAPSREAPPSELPFTRPDAGESVYVPPEPPREEGLYSAPEAVADALSGPLQPIGVGAWTGQKRVKACAYRNERVIVVNVLCEPKEPTAFRVDVFSPRRGIVRVYAEARVPVSTVRRGEYFTFKVETEPPPAGTAGLSPVSLAMSFADLQAYDQARYDRFLPSCFGGVVMGKPQGECLSELAPQSGEWSARHEAFLREPPEEWYRLVAELRTRAGTDAPRGR